MIIYKATNRANGKIYIGQTGKTLTQRISGHLSAKTGYFPKALQKYGLECFDFTIIDTAQSQEELNHKESYWIKFFKCKNPDGYNLTDGGEGTSGYIVSEETIKKRIAGLTVESRAKISEASRNKVFSETALKKISEAMKKRCVTAPPPSQKGVKRTEETIAKMRGMRNALGHVHSKEARAKMASAKIGNKNALGRIQTPEERQKRSDIMKGRKLTAEHKQHMSEAAKKRLLNYPMPWGMYKNKQEVISEIQQQGGL